MAYLYLSIAIIAEVIGTGALKASEGFVKPGASVVAVAGYGAALYFLSIALKTVPIGVAYAIWSGMGIVLIAIVGAMVFKQPPDWPAVVGMILIVLGVAVINLFSKNLNH